MASLESAILHGACQNAAGTDCLTATPITNSARISRYCCTTKIAVTCCKHSPFERCCYRCRYTDGIVSVNRFADHYEFIIISSSGHRYNKRHNRFGCRDACASRSDSNSNKRYIDNTDEGRKCDQRNCWRFTMCDIGGLTP